MCYATWQKEIKVASGIKVVNQVTLKQGEYHRLFGGPSVITGVLQSEEGVRIDQVGELS